MTQVSRRIFEIISDLGLTDNEFAMKFGFSRSTVNNWRNEDVDPGADMIQKFCDSLGITLMEFYGGGVFSEGKESKNRRYMLILKILCKQIIKRGLAEEVIEVMKFLLRDTHYMAS